jgi:hypothetical protein
MLYYFVRVFFISYDKLSSSSFHLDACVNVMSFWFGEPQKECLWVVKKRNKERRKEGGKKGRKKGRKEGRKEASSLA